MLLEGYERYLVRERGPVRTTVRAYFAFAGCFLSKQVEAGQADLASLTPREVTEAVLAECRRKKPGSHTRWLTELRSLLRFLEIEGRTQAGLLQAVPSVPGWKGISLPRYLTRDEVGRLLAGCDRGSLVGCRDFAIITLLARLGLRSLEAANLKLDEIDWRRGEIVVQAKGRCECLPLPSDVGQALSECLHHRTRASCRNVFLAVLAPIEDSMPPVSDVSSDELAVGQACLRSVPIYCAIPPPPKMLNAGASLAEVGQVLRHYDPQTTAIYAKVDRASLRGLTQRWPGAVQ
jgi:site-specific recombinase XerD